MFVALKRYYWKTACTPPECETPGECTAEEISTIERIRDLSADADEFECRAAGGVGHNTIGLCLNAFGCAFRAVQNRLTYTNRR